jgi:cyclin H
VPRNTQCSHNLQATSIQFLRRFYLYNSPMTYHGQNISRTGLFLACKTENAHQSVETFAANFKKTTSDDILAPEYLIVQALRFNFEVKHPFRGLKGGHLELMEMARGRYDGPNCIDEGMTSADLRTRMLQLPSTNSTSKATMQDMEKRITEAYSYASHILKNAAILTDAYFLYTPAQIWLSAHFLADEALTLFYLSLKISDRSPLYAKVLVQLRACAALLSSHRTFQSRVLPKAEVEARDTKHQQDVKRVIDKLKLCRDPEKVDLVKLNQAQKRGGAEDGEVEENKAKRRKVERETYEKANNDFWGPELGKAV